MSFKSPPLFREKGLRVRMIPFRRKNFFARENMAGFLG
jgi:hypothetical protein